MTIGASCGSLISGTTMPCARTSRWSRGAITRSAITSSSGLSSIDSATVATSSDDAPALITPACAAAWNTTKPNSPPCASRMMNTGRSSTGSPIARAMPHRTSAFNARKPTTSAAIRPGCCSTTAKSIVMPTAMKNSPSSRPLNGSRSVSSSRRYSLSASSTPARKAPRAIDSPTDCISAAVATTSSSDAAVKISGVALPAIQRSAGRSSSRPPKTMAAITPMALAAASQPAWPPDAAPSAGSATLTASSGSSARIGIAATSCSSATLSTLWPELVGVRLRSASTDSPMAVDDSARPSAATSASRPSLPASRPTPTISAAEPNSCTLPQPKMGLRSVHSRRGSSSSPTRNSISTTPNSAKCRMSCASVTSFRPHGPMTMPAAR